MKNRRGVGATIIMALVAGLLGPATVSAHHPQNLTFDQLTRRASVIVEGQVTAVNSTWNAAGTQIHTTVTMRVDTFHKGNLRQNQMQIRMLGGIVGNTTMVVLGQPTFAVNDRVMLFLKPNYDQHDVPFVGAHEGKFQVILDRATGQDVLDNRRLRIPKTGAVDTIKRIMRPVLEAVNVTAGEEE